MPSAIAPSVPAATSIPVISERAIDDPRPLKLIYIGAGVSGIVAAIQFLKSVPSLDLVIYEKNPEIGGTWYENRYPGCACDIPSHAYQLSFESSTDWSSFYAGAPEILKYWQAVADKYGVKKHVRFSHKCIGATWDEASSKWRVKFERGDTTMPEIFEDEADIFMTGTGLLNEWAWPTIKGIEAFKGSLLHTANWDDKFDATNKTVAVVGAGSSGIQVVPALVGKVKSMDHYVRGKTWISNQLSDDLLKQRAQGSETTNFQYTPEEQDFWKRDPLAYIEYRKVLEKRLQGNYAVSRSDHPRHGLARDQFTQNMRERLASKPELAEFLIPDFPPLCKRLTPGPGYLEALTEPKVNVISNPIAYIDEGGIVTADGVKRPVDAIVCATGFNTSPGAGFPILGRDGINLRHKYAVRPKSYLGLCTDNFPNFFQSLGPNSFQGAGNLLISIEQSHWYVAKILRRMAVGNIRTVEPKRKSVENFTNYCDEYFKHTVYTTDCASWYKAAPPGATKEQQYRARVTALWPGSSIHAVKALEYVRWEDFDLETCDGNEFGWFGNGWTRADREAGGEDVEGLSWYINGTGFLHEGLGPAQGNSGATSYEAMITKVEEQTLETSDYASDCVALLDEKNQATISEVSTFQPLL